MTSSSRGTRFPRGWDPCFTPVLHTRKLSCVVLQHLRSPCQKTHFSGFAATPFSMPENSLFWLCNNVCPVLHARKLTFLALPQPRSPYQKTNFSGFATPFSCQKTNFSGFGTNTKVGGRGADYQNEVGGAGAHTKRSRGGGSRKTSPCAMPEHSRFWLP